MKTTSLLALVIAALFVIFLSPPVLAVSDETEIFPFGSSWTWLHPQNGVDPGTSQPGFQANWMKASWANFANSGAGILGYDVFNWGSLATDIGTPASGQRYTAYFKRNFTLSGSVSGLFFADLLCDDGCVIYVAGVRVGDWNYAGPDTYVGLSITSANESREVWVQLSIPGGNLAAGAHTIAVSLHNVQNTSSDLAFDLRLINATGAANTLISKPEFGSSYQVLWFPNKPTWDQARTAALQAGGRLPVIESAAENQFLVGLLSPDRFWVRRHENAPVPLVTFYEGPWVGAYQPTGSLEPAGGWIWVDGTTAINAPWRSAQPDNNGGAESWAQYWGINQKEATLNDTGVEGLSNAVIVEFSGTSLSPPNITAPGSTVAPGTVELDLTPTFAWEPVNGATGYGLYIRDVTTNTLIYGNDGGQKTGTSFTLPNGYLTNNGHAFRWAMTCFSGTIESVNQSSYRYFKTPGTPGTPILVSEGSSTPPGPTLTTLTPILSWQKPTGATGYNVAIRDVQTLTLVYTSPLGDVGYVAVPPGKLQAGRSYRWNANATGPGGSSAYAPPLYFQTATSPTNGPDLVPESLTISPAFVLPGGDVIPSFFIANRGLGASQPTTVKVWLTSTSTPPTITQSSLFTGNVPVLQVGQSTAFSPSVTVPASLYHYRHALPLGLGGFIRSSGTAGRSAKQ